MSAPNSFYNNPAEFMMEDNNKELQTVVDAKGSKIIDFYAGKSVFVTGATGFLGKLLVEKLLRACPDIDTVYILVRPKKGEDEHTRVDKLYSDVIFNPLRKLRPKFQHKIITLRGDVSLPNLGLSAEDRQVIVEKVNVIFHIAATVKFDEKISLATAINVRGTRDLLEIARECKKLDSFQHISTAYANCNRKTIDECFYTPPITADELIALVEKTPENVLETKTVEILGDWPNTYAYTKAIAENAVKEHVSGLPVCIFRPAIVIATYKEPLRSWIDNLYGATGVVVGAGTGLLRSMHCVKEMSAELVPADYVINGLIAASYKTAIERPKEVPIYNYVSSVENRLTWEDFMATSAKYGEDIPTIRCIWYYCLTVNRFKLVHYLYVLLLHFIPAIIMDGGLILAGKRPIMTKIYRKITKFESVLSYFATQQWKFTNNNTQALWRWLSDPDQGVFPFSMKSLDWEDYQSTHLMGLRVYLVKDDPSTLPEARKKWNRLYVAHQILKYSFYLTTLLVTVALPSLLYLYYFDVIFAS